jgi:hypothetical protein
MSGQHYSAQSTGKQVDTSVDALRAIANHCGRGEKSGRNWKCNCPICGRHSLSVTSGKRISILIKCWNCEAIGLDGYTEQRDYLIGVGLLDPNDRDAQRLSPEECARQDAERRAEALRTWNGPSIEPITPERTAAKYLRARGLESFMSHPALRCTASQLVSRVWHADYGLSALQWTLLLIDGSDRDRSEKRRTWGVLKGGAVWINAPKPGEEFVVAEGLETLLSALLLLKLRCGAAVLGPNLKGLVLPPDARMIHIAADNDEVGRPSADAAFKFWRAQGLHVRMSMPDVEWQDFNDVLKGIRQ